MSDTHEPRTSDELLGELLERNRRRRRARKWIGICAILPLLVAAILVVKLLSMYAFAHQSVRAFVANDFEGTVAAAEWQGVINWFEPYKAHYNRGTGLAELGELDKARADFEEAVTLVSGIEVCAVRYNFATVVERQGDRATGADEIDKGQDLYREALEILSAAPKECGTPAADASSPDQQRSMRESLDELALRIMEKIIQEPPPSGGQSEEPPQEPQEPQEPEQGDQGSQPDQQNEPSDSQLDEVEKKLQDGAQQRQDRKQGGSGDGGGGGTDKPW